MAIRVREIMNREVFQARPADSVEQTLDGLLAMGITGAPVTDEKGRPLGVVSLRDLLTGKEGATAAERMTAPAVVVRADAPIADAASLIAHSGYRRLPVIDDEGRVIGMVSVLDVLRALLGLPAVHPSAFPHFDLQTGLSWSDDAPLAPENVDVAPEGPGCLALVYGGAGSPESVVWVESPNNVRTRLIDMLSLPQDSPELTRLLERRDHLRFRTASVADPELREKVKARLRARVHRMIGLKAER
jgi:CBS domain-containing protein